MALVFMDGLDNYTTDADLTAGGWYSTNPGSTTPSTTSGRWGTGGVRLVYEDSIRRTISMTGSTIICQFAFKHDDILAATNERILRMWNGGITGICLTLDFTAAGVIRAGDTNGAVVGSSSAGVIRSGVWQFLEVKAVISNTGSITVKIDGQQVINATSVDTQPGVATDVDAIFFAGASENASDGVTFDDIVIMDGSGTKLNDFIGDSRISPLLPNADTATADWALSAGLNGYDLINDTMPGGHDGDGTYIYSNTVSEKSLFDLENLSTNPETIHAVSVNVAAKKSDSGTRTMRAYLDSNGTTDNGSAWSIATSYEIWRYYWDTDPNTSLAWLIAGINALKVGVEVVS
jgi:hypothetical protein